jgi:hypothetical protein
VTDLFAVEPDVDPAESIGKLVRTLDPNGAESGAAHLDALLEANVDAV